MSATSVGTGTPDDSNENPVPDSWPSKTLGAESGPDAKDRADASAHSAHPSTQADLSSEEVAPPEIGLAVAADAAHTDGRHGVPVPHELDAARGKA